MFFVLHQASAQAPLWDGFLTEHVRPLGPEELGLFTNKRILITGAGGYLGSALAKALASLPVGQLVLLDHAEHGLYRLGQDFKDAGHPAPATMVVGSVLNRSLLREIFTNDEPEIVFHAAALKHVPLMESNPFAAAETNVLGTERLVEAAARSSSLTRLLLLSTDKAADPISVMGATKRVAEQIVLRAHAASPEQFLAVRLCNVLGSTGSVAPLFAEQIARGAPLTLTHPEATRFFLSTADAVRLLVRAATLPTQTGLLIPLLESPYPVRDLACFMLQHATQPHSSSQIVETGLRRGDKMHEQLLSGSERAHPGSDSQMMAVASPFDRAALAEALREISTAAETRRGVDLFKAIQSVVPTWLGEESAPTERTATAVATA